MVLPVPLEVIAEIPVKDSCNCCDKSKFSFICCSSRAKSPNATDQKASEVALKTFKLKEGKENAR